MTPNLPTPVINGQVYSFASVELDLDGLIFVDVTAIDYADSVKPGKIYGTGGVLIGRTPGVSKPTLSITMTRRCWDSLRTSLADRSEHGTFSTTPFPVAVKYFEKQLAGNDSIPDQLVTDIIYQVRAIGPSSKNAQGNAASLITIECDPWQILWGKTSSRDGDKPIDDDSEGSTVTENDPVTGSNVASEGSATWWARSDDGFEAAGDGLHAPNSWDTFSAFGIQFPGKCVVTASAPPSRAIESQKPNGSDAAAIIDRGFTQAILDVEVTLWMREHFALWENIIREIWRTPGKASQFEAPLPQAATAPGPAKAAAQAQQLARTNAPIFREIKAIKSGVTAAAQHAIDIYHPTLALLKITKAIVESPGILVAGPEPQTMVAKMKFRQYIEPGKRNVTGKVKGSAPSKNQKIVVVDALSAQGLTSQADPSTSFSPANSPVQTPAATQSKP